MNSKFPDFLGSLFAMAPELERADREARSDWLPDEPPVTTLFAALGDRIATSFNVMPNSQSQAVFRHIESAMTSGDRELVTAVATGLIEGMVSRASQYDGLWPRIGELLGPRSMKHAEAWLGD